MANKDIKRLIDERGGYLAVSEALTERGGARVPKTTVHSWWRKNTIPAWRIAGLMALPKVSKQGRDA